MGRIINEIVYYNSPMGRVNANPNRSCDGKLISEVKRLSEAKLDGSWGNELISQENGLRCGELIA